MAGSQPRRLAGLGLVRSSDFVETLRPSGVTLRAGVLNTGAQSGEERA